MRKILRIAKANVSKHKGATVSLFIIITIVSALMTVGLSVLVQVDANYWDSVDRGNSMHNVFIIPREQYKASLEDILGNDPRVSSFECTEVLFADNPSVYYSGKTDIGTVFANLSAPVSINAPNITEHDDSVPAELAVYLPEFAKTIGFKTGDPFSIEYKNHAIELVVAGFFPTTIFANSQQGVLRFFVSPECYEYLAQYINRSVYIADRLYDVDDAMEFQTYFSDEADVEFVFWGSAFAWDVQDSAVSALSPVYTMSAIILLFAVILTLVSILVIRFRVTNSIENRLPEIGVLKAQGYTSRQIKASYLAEHILLSVPASALGVLAAMPVFPQIREMFFAMSGFPWSFSVSAAAAVLTMMAVSASLLLMVWRSTRRIKKLPPVMALRGDTEEHSARRNFFPLKKFPGNIHFGLGLKNMFAYSKIYAMIGVVVAGISLAITFMAVMYMNTVIDHTALIKVTGFEVSDVAVTVTRHADADALAAEIELMPEVRKTAMMDITGLKVEGFSTFANVSDDFGKLETVLPNTGRMPIFDNEIAIPGVFRRMLAKEIGDSVTVKSGGVSKEFIITGTFSSSNNGGKVAMLTTEGYRRMDSSYKRSSINVYLNDGVTPAVFSEKLNRQDIEKIIDYQEFFNAQLGNYTGAIGAVAQVITVVSLLISSLVLVMTVRSIIAKRRREIGIMKAGGFTTKQLARQMAVSFLPITALGVVLGCVIGALTISPAMGAALAAAGAENVVFDVDPLIVAVLGAAIMLVTYAVSNTSARRIRNISVYELLTE